MKKGEVPVILCEYAKTEKSLWRLLEESFRLYLVRVLAAERSDVVSYER